MSARLTAAQPYVVVVDGFVPSLAVGAFASQPLAVAWGDAHITGAWHTAPLVTQTAAPAALRERKRLKRRRSR